MKKISLIIAALCFSACASKKVAQIDNCEDNSTNACNVKYLGMTNHQTIRIEAQKGKLFESRRMEVRLRDIYLPRKNTEDECEKQMASKVEAYLSQITSDAEELDILNLRRRWNLSLNADFYADNKRVNDLLYAHGYVLANGEGRSWCDVQEELARADQTETKAESASQ